MVKKERFFSFDCIVLFNLSGFISELTTWLEEEEEDEVDDENRMIKGVCLEIIKSDNMKGHFKTRHK